MKSRTYLYMVAGISVSAFFSGALLWVPARIITVAQLPAADEVIKKSTTPRVLHRKTPAQVRGIYMTACAASSSSFRNKLISLIDETELNSVVIDVKDFSGTISFVTKDPRYRQETVSGCRVADMKGLVKMLHEKGIYVIARMTVFQDPYYAKRHPDIAVQKESDKSIWRDYKELAFIDAGATEYWKYIVGLSKEAYSIGFDEINFDYIRYPSDGDMKDIYYPISEERVVSNPEYGKALVLRDFFSFLYTQLHPTGVKLSADVFGMTTTNTDDLNIGQILEYVTPYFDYVAPMTYPSHYPSGFFGITNPNTDVYKVVNISVAHAVNRLSATTTVVFIPGAEIVASSTPPLYKKVTHSSTKLRPWIQDFDYGGTYGVKEVQAQIQAVHDAGVDSWILWDPSNRYTRGALANAE